MGVCVSGSGFKIIAFGVLCVRRTGHNTNLQQGSHVRRWLAKPITNKRTSSELIIVRRDRSRVA